MAIFDILTPFVLGLLTPLTAACVLPLYPGFLAYLSNQLNKKANRGVIFAISLLIVLGVVLFMFLLGILFTTLFQKSLTNVIGIVSPIAFGILTLISILLILDVDFGKFLPKYNAPVTKNPLWSAFIFGFFFGAIVIPCNPAFLAALFARSLLIQNFATNLLNFILFGLGIGFPLLVLGALVGVKSKEIISFLTKHKTFINRTAGIIMLGISLYYLIFVFHIFDIFV